MAAHLATSSFEAASGLLANGVPHSHRGIGNRVVTTYVPTLVKGANPTLLAVPPNSTTQQFFALNQAIPQQEFPIFDGMNPKLWKKCCEAYFDVYAVPEHLWVKIGVMNFTGSATFLSQSVESILQRCTWSDLCTAICSRFEHDQQNSLNRQFFGLKQTNTVAEYIEKFDELIHQILAHDPCFSPHVITSRFVDGLKDEIRVVV